MSQRTVTAISFLVIGLVIGFGIGYFIPSGAPPETPQDTSLQTVVDRGTLIVGTSADYPPFEFLNATNDVVGFDADLMEYVASYLNVTVVWQNMEFDSLVGACQAGTIDVIAAAMFISEDRAAKLQHSIPYIQTEMSIVVMNNSVLEISSLDDLSGHTVGVQTGSVEDSTLSAISGVSVTRYATADLMFTALDLGSVEAIFIDTPVVTTYAALYNIKTILQLAAEQTVLYVGRDADSLLIEINSAISAGLQDGTIDALINEWF